MIREVFKKCPKRKDNERIIVDVNRIALDVTLDNGDTALIEFTGIQDPIISGTEEVIDKINHETNEIESEVFPRKMTIDFSPSFDLNIYYYSNDKE